MVNYMNEQYATARELAVIFKCSERTIRTRIDELRRDIQFQNSIIKGAGSMKINVEDFRKFLTKRGRGNG